MTESENEKIIEKMFEAVNRHDLDAMMDLCSDDVTFVWADGTRGDKEGERKYMAGIFTIFPDARCRVDRMISQGNTVVVEITFTGTHKEEYLGIPATNKKVEIPFVEIFDFEAGKVKLHKEYWNPLILEQLLRE